MKISEEYSMPIFSIPIRAKEFTSSYKSLYDIIQNEVGFEISFENIFLGLTEIKDGTIADIIQQVKDTSQKISVNCQLVDDSVQIINNRISAVNQIIEFESKYISDLSNQSLTNLELKSNLHTTFLNSLRNSFCGYASQVGWSFLNSFGINNDNYENSSTIFNDLIDIIPIEIKDLFDNLLNLTPLCHPDNYFLDQSIEFLIKLSENKKIKKNANKDKSNNTDSNFVEEEEDANSLNIFNVDTDFNDSQENILMQNIDDYSMSTDEFVTTVEHILGQKDDIKVSKSYDDENWNRKKFRLDPINVGQVYFNNDLNKNNESGINPNSGKNLNNLSNESSGSKNKEADYSRFFLFGKNNNNNSLNENLQEKNLLFPSETPNKKTNYIFISDSKSTPISNQNNFLFNFPDATDSERKNKTPIKRSIKLDSSKKYAYTPEERRNKAKQISKFIKSTKDNQFSNFSLFISPPPPKINRQLLQEENTQPFYTNQNEYDFLGGKKPKSYAYSANNNRFNISDENLSSLDQSNQLTEIIDFNIDDDVNIDENKKKNQINYRHILSPEANFMNHSDIQSRKRKSKKQDKIKNVQFNKDEL